MKTFAPATGFLGDLTWWPEHRRAVRAAGRVFPKWDQPYGSGGRVTEARLTPPQGYVMPKAHLTASIKACMMQPPLSMSATEFDELGITAHSEHGSPSDMLTTIGTQSPFGSFLHLSLGGRWGGSGSGTRHLLPPSSHSSRTNALSFDLESAFQRGPKPLHPFPSANCGEVIAM